MKISKLFHWLYAILMFLPIVFFGASVIQNIVHNTNADFDIQYKYETNDVNSAEDLIQGNIYTLTLDYNTVDYIYGYQFDISGYIVDMEYQFSYVDDIYFDENALDSEVFGYAPAFRIFDSDYREVITYVSYDYNYDSYYACYVDLKYNGFIDADNYLKMDFIFIDYYATDISLIDFGFITRCENIPYEIIEVDNGITNILYRSLDSTFNLPIFEWAKDSFLIIPFSFIGSLFGLSASNLIIVMLDYWLCISIIWLVFDIVMYFPLLIHRWLDKGVGQ